MIIIIIIIVGAAFYNQPFKQVPPSNNSHPCLSKMREFFEASKNKTINYYIDICFTVKYGDTFPHCRQCCLVQSELGAGRGVQIFPIKREGLVK